MSVRQRSVGLLFLAALACLAVSLLCAGVDTAWAQQRIYPVPTTPPRYSAEPPLAGAPAPPQAAPAAPGYPAIRPIAAPPAAGTFVAPEPPVPTVAIHVQVPATAAAGQELEYRLCVQNHSQAPAHHVLVRDPLPKNAQFVRATPEPTTREPELQWALGTLTAGACKTITLILRPTGSGDVVNCARVQFEYGQCVTTHISGAAPTQPPPPAKPAPATLTLQKRGPAAGLRYKTMLDYEVTVCNTGTAPATDLKLTDTLPDGLDYVSDGKGADAPRVTQEPVTRRNILTWALASLAPGKCHTVTYRAVAKLTGRLTNTAVVTAAGGLRQQAQSTVTITEPAVKLDAAGPRTRYVNTPTTYTLTVRNTGTTPLTNVVLRHPMPAGSIVLRATAGGQFKDGTTVQWALGTLPPGTACRVQLTWRTPKAGKLSVHPTVSADPGQTAQTDVSTDFVAASALSLSVADKDDPIELKEKTAYRITVLNQGQVPATNVRIVAAAPPQERIVAPTDVRYRSQVSFDQRSITFEPLTIPAGQKVELEVPVQPVAVGDARFHVTMTADQLTSGKVVAEESTTIYEDMPAAPVPPSRSDKAMRDNLSAPARSRIR